MFSHADLLALTLGLAPGAVSVEAAEKAVGCMEARGDLHAATRINHGWATDAAIARAAKTIALAHAGQDGASASARRMATEGGGT